MTRINIYRHLINTAWIFLIALILVASVFVVMLHRSYVENENLRKKLLNITTLSDRFLLTTYDLSERARSFVVTADPKELQSYWNEIRIVKTRTQILHDLTRLSLDKQEKALLNKVKTNLKQINVMQSAAMKMVLFYLEVPVDNMPREIREFYLSENVAKLTNEQKIINARSILFGSMYISQMQELEKAMADYKKQYTTQILNDIETSCKFYRKIMILTAILTCVIFILILLICWTHYRNNKYPVILFFNK